MISEYAILWQRFKKIKRAYWSLLFLSIAYLLSLGAEIFCSNIPLTMRFDNQRIYPVLSHYFESFYYTEDYFLHNNRQTRPNYKYIINSQEFRSNPNNSVLMPLIPYDPLESMSVDALKDMQNVEVRLVPTSTNASVDINGAGIVKRSKGLQSILSIDDSFVVGKKITDFFDFNADLKNAIDNRFKNKNSNLFSSVIHKQGITIVITLRKYRAHLNAPSKLRLKLKLKQVNAKEVKMLFNANKELINAKGKWQQIEAKFKKQILHAVEMSKTNNINPFIVNINHTRFRVYVRQLGIVFPMAPNKYHWLGLDDTGRDVFARVLYGFRTSMTFAIILVIFSMGLGVVIGAIQGYFGGIIDIVAQRLTEIWESLPFLYVMIFMGAVYGQSFILLLFCYAIFNWIGISYYMRAEFLRLRSLPFVESAKTLGLPTWRIIFLHILPNALVPIVTFFPFSLVSAIGSLTALDYLGFGLPVPTPSWGELFKQAQNDPSAWWLILYPFLALFVVILLGVFIGEGARAAFDPKRESKVQ